MRYLCSVMYIFQTLNLCDICLLVSFYNGSLVVAISSILSTILSLRWTRLPSKSAPPPTFIQSCLSGRIGTILGVSHKVIKYFVMPFFFHLFFMPNLTIFFYCFQYSSSNLLVAKELTDKSSQQFVPDGGESQEIEIKQHWTNICVALDRIMLFIYFTFFTFHVINFLG